MKLLVATMLVALAQDVMSNAPVRRQPVQVIGKVLSSKSSGLGSAKLLYYIRSYVYFSYFSWYSSHRP